MLKITDGSGQRFCQLPPQLVMSTFTRSITSFSRPSKLPVVVCLLILFSSPHLHTRENHLMSHKCGWAVAIRSSRLECEDARRMFRGKDLTLESTVTLTITALCYFIQKVSVI